MDQGASVEAGKPWGFQLFGIEGTGVAGRMLWGEARFGRQREMCAAIQEVA